MRRIRYQVACSLDGYIAGPNGEFDWIPMDPDIDFQVLFDQFDTLLMGRRTFEVVGSDFPGKTVLVFSRSLGADDCPDARLVNDDVPGVINELRQQPGRDIWLYGGGELFRSLLEVGCVDSVELAVVPVLLGDGIPLLKPGAASHKLVLSGQHTYAKSGIVLLQYGVSGPG